MSDLGMRLHPDLSVTQKGERWVLRFSAPDVHGTVSSASKAGLRAIAAMYAGWRRWNPPARAVTGEDTRHG